MPGVRPTVAEWVLQFRPPLTSAPPSTHLSWQTPCTFLYRLPYKTPLPKSSLTAVAYVGSILRRRLTTAYGISVLRRRQRPTSRHHRGGVVARDGGCIHGRGRDKRAHRDIIIISTEVWVGGLRHNGKKWYLLPRWNLWCKAGCVFPIFTPPCADFRTFLSAIDFGAPLAHLARLPSFSNFNLGCPLCPPRLHHASTAPCPAPAPPLPHPNLTV